MPDIAEPKTGTKIDTNGAKAKEAKPTRYVILYRVEGDPTNVYTEALDLAWEGDVEEDGRPRLVVEAYGQNKAREEFLALVAEDDSWGKVVQIAAVPYSSWDPKTPRTEVKTTWD